jgi:hypothetical protein
MSSVKCKECGFVSFAGTPYCKRCGASLASAHLVQLPTGAMVTEDGYVLPPPPSFGGHGVWRDKSTLVMEKNAALPDRCVKCNEPAFGQRLKRKLSWHHPAIYLIILVALLIYLVVAMVLRKTATIEVGVCERHMKTRRRSIVITWGAIIFSIILLFVAASYEDGGVALFGLALFVGAVIYGIITVRIVAPAKIDDRFVWLRGVNKEYLSELPAWPGY